ncbi:MAG: ATP-binding protein [Chitinophagaceae bacterium]
MFSDNGIGFNQKFAEKIFIIFQRLVGRSEFAGTGIGLAICRKIAINHQGLIFANSTEEEGANFHIILPCDLKGE